jgi:hypothetical protein
VESKGLKARYVTLSHRWGSDEQFTLTFKTRESMMNDIPWTSIPKTYQDAITLTRQLEISYLWIDSVCIIQSSEEDWSKESLRMRQIYGQAYLNIAASDAEDSNAGIFCAGSDWPTRYPRHAIPGFPGLHIQPQLLNPHRDFMSDYSSQSLPNELLRRGWVLQERLLAPRVVYYTENELQWECKRSADCQCGGLGVVARFRADYERCLLNKELQLPVVWMRVVEKYSDMILTYDKDRLVALAGIAQQLLDTRRGGRYLAGLWEINLAHQLCWMIHNAHRRPKEYVAPSWSWASVFGLVYYFNRNDWEQQKSKIDAEIMEVNCKSVVDGDSTGSVVAGHLKLRGWCGKMRALIRGFPNGNQASINLPSILAHVESQTVIKWFLTDFLFSEEAAEKIQHVMLLYFGQISNTYEFQHVFMVLKETTEGTLPSERVGMSYPVRTIHQEVQKIPIYERLGLLWFAEEDEIVKTLLQICDCRDEVVIV